MAEATARKVKGKNPAAQFYWADWLRDPALRSISSGARGLWMDILCLMWECTPKGHLQTRTGQPFSVEMICRMTGNISEEEVNRWLMELDNSGVSSLSASGVLISRRMVRDEHKRALCREAGHKGGNPKLKEWFKLPGFVYAIEREEDRKIKLGASVDPSDRLRKGMGSLKGGGCRLVRQWPVTVMGEAEGFLHAYFAPKCVGGEWFNLTAEDLDSIESVLTVNCHLKGQSKGAPKGQSKRNPTPSSSTSVEDVPLGLRTEEFLQSWKEWQAHRREIKEPLTETQTKKQLRQFEQWGASRAVAAINHTILKGWTGLREPDSNGPFKPKQGQFSRDVFDAFLNDGGPNG